MQMASNPRQHRWREIHVSKFVFLFSCPQNLSINHLNFHCIKQIDNYSTHIFLYVCTVTENVTACKEQQSRHSTWSRVVLFCSLIHAVTSSVIYYCTHKRKVVIYLLNNRNKTMIEL